MEASTRNLRIKGLKLLALILWWYAVLLRRKTNRSLGASTKDDENRKQEN